MCHCKQADDDARHQNNRPVQEIEVPCNLLPRQPLPQAPAASLRLEVPAAYEVLLVCSLSLGTGEVTAALNVLPLLPPGTRVLYGAGANATAEERHRGRAQIRQMTSLLPDVLGEWDWTDTNGYQFVSQHRSITPGNRPLLVLAPHGYVDREVNFVLRTRVPEGSVLVSWSPFGYPNPDLRDHHGVKLRNAAIKGLGYRSSLGEDGTDELHKESLYSVVPPAPQFDPGQAVSPSEVFAVQAYEMSRQEDNRLACLYGHGTNADPDKVLVNLLTAAKAGTLERRWAVILVIHHATDDDPGPELSRPAHLKKAFAQLPDTVWLPGPGVEGNAASGTWTCDKLRIKIYHLKGLDKRCMDWLFRIADLPVVEGANSVVQLMSAGRPFVRAARGEEFLGMASTHIVRDCPPKYAAARADLRAASKYLSEDPSDRRGPAALRALLFTSAERGPMDDFATYLSNTYFVEENNPLAFIRPFLEKQPVPMVADDARGLTFGL